MKARCTSDVIYFSTLNFPYWCQESKGVPAQTHWPVFFLIIKVSFETYYQAIKGRVFKGRLNVDPKAIQHNTGNQAAEVNTCV
jgi:hypothetical protein